MKSRPGSGPLQSPVWSWETGARLLPCSLEYKDRCSPCFSGTEDTAARPPQGMGAAVSFQPHYCPALHGATLLGSVSPLEELPVLTLRLTPPPTVASDCLNPVTPFLVFTTRKYCCQFIFYKWRTSDKTSYKFHSNSPVSWTLACWKGLFTEGLVPQQHC